MPMVNGQWQWEPLTGRSGTDVNFENAQAERERRLAAVIANPGMMTVQSDPRWDAFYGGLDRTADMAHRAGMNYRTDWTSLARALTPDRLSLSDIGSLDPNIVRGQIANDEAARRMAERLSQERVAKNRQAEISNDLWSDYIQHQQTMANAPPVAPMTVTESGGKVTMRPSGTLEEQLIGRLSPAQFAAFRKQQSDADIARTKARAELERAQGKDTARFWVMRDGKPVRISEAEYQPGDQPASTREQGRPVTSGDTGRISDLNTSLDDLDVLRKTLTETSGATGTSAAIGAALPAWATDLTGWGEDAKKRQGVIDRVKQVIGKALEGGVLRKEDEIKYENILPTIRDTAAVAESKLSGLKDALTKRRQTFIEDLSKAGYETSEFEKPRSTSKAPAGESRDQRIDRILKGGG